MGRWPRTLLSSPVRKDHGGSCLWMADTEGIHPKRGRERGHRAWRGDKGEGGHRSQHPTARGAPGGVNVPGHHLSKRLPALLPPLCGTGDVGS